MEEQIKKIQENTSKSIKQAQSKQELNDIADKQLLSTLSEEQRGKFVQRPISRPTENGMGDYGVTYCRYVHGYPTDVNIYVRIAQDKTILEQLFLLL